ncbi:MAG: response regulator, partial [Betaproteobacteria bacterium]
MAAADPTILVVEDEPAIVELISFSLKGAGWSVDTVGDTASAWGYLQQKRPQLVLLDWMLPDQSGIKLLSRIR